LSVRRRWFMPRREFIARRHPWFGLVLISDIIMVRPTVTGAGEFWRNWGEARW
jgi:hypothetical protein